jgi:hypothetical protein
VADRDEHDEPNRSWRIVKAPDKDSELAYTLRLGMFPVHRGPSQRARFLTSTIQGACAGSVGESYQLSEWNPRGHGELDTVFTIHGAGTQEGGPPDDLSNSFPPVGVLRTEGPAITLPYCWSSAIDTWDNASLCAADSYDLSGDWVQFKRRVTNRPDLVPIAAAIDRAQAHEYREVLAYCLSSGVAARILREIPASLFADTLTVTRLGATKERVEFGWDATYRFEVQRRGATWTISRFQIWHR